MPRILLVHADSDDRDMYAEYLRMRGYEVRAVSRTDEALPLIPSADLLVTGLMVPGSVYPIALIEGARAGEWGRSVPVIVVTASILFPLHRAAEDAGASHVLLKPCYPGDLLKCVEAALHGLEGPSRSKRRRRIRTDRRGLMLVLPARNMAFHVCPKLRRYAQPPVLPRLISRDGGGVGLDRSCGSARAVRDGLDGRALPAGRVDGGLAHSRPIGANHGAFSRAALSVRVTSAALIGSNRVCYAVVSSRAGITQW